jgi:hypothetical protein
MEVKKNSCDLLAIPSQACKLLATSSMTCCAKGDESMLAKERSTMHYRNLLVFLNVTITAPG